MAKIDLEKSLDPLAGRDSPAADGGPETEKEKQMPSIEDFKGNWVIQKDPPPVHPAGHTICIGETASGVEVKCQELGCGYEIHDMVYNDKAHRLQIDQTRRKSQELITLDPNVETRVITYQEFGEVGTTPGSWTAEDEGPPL